MGRGGYISGTTPPRLIYHIDDGKNALPGLVGGLVDLRVGNDEAAASQFGSVGVLAAPFVYKITGIAWRRICGYNICMITTYLHNIKFIQNEFL